jgi:hypothetical protein
MTTIFQWRVHCTAENKDVFIWSIDKPTLCPNDHIDRAVINAVIVDSLSPTDVIANEPSTGYYQAVSIPMEIPTTELGKLVEIDISFPMDVLLWKTDCNIKESMIGDNICVIIDPDQSIGLITDDALSGINTIKVDSNTLEKIQIGFDVSIDDGNKKENLGRVVDINKEDGVVIVENPPSTNFYKVSNVAVLLNICMVRYIIFEDAGDKFVFGDKGFKGKIIEKNTKLRVSYTNNNGLAKTWYWRVE